MPVAGLPADECGAERIAEREIVRLEVATHPERRRQVEFGAGADVLPADRHDRAEPNASAQNFTARYPEQRRQVIGDIGIDTGGMDATELQRRLSTAAVMEFDVLQIDAGRRGDTGHRAF